MAKKDQPAKANEIEHVLTEQDFENNPSLAAEGLKVGDTINYDPSAAVDEAELEALAVEIEKATSIEELDAITNDNETIVALIATRKEELEAEAVAAAEAEEAKVKADEEAAAEAAKKEEEAAAAAAAEDKPVKGQKTLKRGVCIAGNIFEKGFTFNKDHKEAKTLNKYA